MDPFVLDAHQDHPERIVPMNRHRQGQGPDGLVDNAANGITIGPDFVHGRPVVVRGVEVVPGHLIDADGEHRFEAGIDPLVRDLGDDQLVDVEGGRVPEIEDQRVPQRFGPQIKALGSASVS